MAHGVFHGDNPDSARGSAGGMSEDLRASMQRAPGGPFDADHSHGIPPQLSSPVPAGPSASDQKFGAGFWMPQVDDDPLYLGPLKSSFVFPLPSSVEEAVQLAWTASYRYAPPPMHGPCFCTLVMRNMRHGATHYRSDLVPWHVFRPRPPGSLASEKMSCSIRMRAASVGLAPMCATPGMQPAAMAT